jgi:hypothetical protein
LRALVMLCIERVRAALLEEAYNDAFDAGDFPLPSIVELAADDEPLHGRAMCDDLQIVHKLGLEARRGALSPRTLREIDRALMVVLALA